MPNQSMLGARSLLPVLLTFIVSLPPIQSSDWPQFLGPARDGVYPDAAELAPSWPADGPPRVWKMEAGQGFSGPVVSQGKVLLFQRRGNQETTICYNSGDGKILWQSAHPTAYQDDFGFDEGPRSTPCIHDGKVFTMGAEGTIECLDFATGNRIWQVKAKEKFAARKGFFGMACSPLIMGQAVLLNIGGADGAGIIALNRDTGSLIWKATEDEASYSSPVASMLNGRPCAIFFTRAGLAAIDPVDGNVLTRFPWRSRSHASVNAATPLIIGASVFISASYETGAALLELHPGQPKVIWSGDDILSNHYASSVCKDGFLFGFDGRQEYGPRFRCVEAKTGKVRWTQDHFGAGTVTLAGDDLFILMEDGRLLRAAASPDKFQIKSESQILGAGVRSYPALAGGFLFARSKDQLLCLDLRKR